MKRIILTIFILGLISLTASAVDALIITKEGKSLIAHNVTKDGNLIHYAPIGGGQESVAVADLYQIVPRFARGTKYKPATVNTYIRIARAAQREYPKLRKQIQPRIDEWQAVRDQFEKLTPEAKTAMEEEIQAKFTAFQAGEKSFEDFYRLRSDLEMLRYKDLQGAFDELIQEKLQQLAAEQLEKNIDMIKGYTREKDLSVDKFNKYSKMCETLIKNGLHDDKRALVNKCMNTFRTNCIKYEVDKLAEKFPKTASLDDYLEANKLLSDLQAKIALRRHSIMLNSRRLRMQRTITQGGYDFGCRGMFGFPADQTDIELMRTCRPWLSDYDRPLRRPVAVFYLTEPMPRVDIREDRDLKFRAILCQTPPSTKFRFNIEPFNVKISNPEVTIENAHLEMQISTATLRKIIAEKGRDKIPSGKIKISLCCEGPDVQLSNPVALMLKL